MANLLLLTEEEDLFLRQAIEAWSAVYAGDSVSGRQIHGC